jgi:hypothetical protein
MAQPSETTTAEAKATSVAGTGKKSYVALTDIEHDLKPVPAGKRLMLTEDEAAPLLGTNPPAIKPAGKATEEAPTE